PPALPSPPTRRSSDLLPQPGVEGRPVLADEGDGAVLVQGQHCDRARVADDVALELDAVGPPEAGPVHAEAEAAVLHRARFRGPEDRKSTRLNSSHVKI